METDKSYTVNLTGGAQLAQTETNEHQKVRVTPVYIYMV